VTRKAFVCPVLLLACLAAGCRSFGPSDAQKRSRLLWGDRPGRDSLGLLISNAEVRRWSILNLARHGDPMATPAIEPLLKSSLEPSPLVRSTAAVALRMLGDRRAIPSLVEACSDRNALVRADVAGALGALGGPEEVPALSRMLGGDRDPGVRQEAARALGRIGGEDAVNSLIQALSDRNESVAFAAHRALIRITGQDLPPASHAWMDWMKLERPAAEVQS